MTGTVPATAGPVGLAATDLSLGRGYRQLVSGLSLSLSSGDAVALRGPNGSGKTTLLRALAGLHRPRGGSITITLGGEALEEPGQALVFMGHQDAIKAAETVRDQLSFWAAFHRAPPDGVVAVATRLGLGAQLDLPGGVLSAGQRRRLALARVLLATRAIWLLDEPAAPLDHHGRRLLGRLMDDHRAAGGIIVAAVHDTPPGAPMTDVVLG